MDTLKTKSLCGDILLCQRLVLCFIYISYEATLDRNTVVESQFVALLEHFWG